MKTIKTDRGERRSSARWVPWHTWRAAVRAVITLPRTEIRPSRSKRDALQALQSPGRRVIDRENDPIPAPSCASPTTLMAERTLRPCR